MIMCVLVVGSRFELISLFIDSISCVDVVCVVLIIFVNRLGW